MSFSQPASGEWHFPSPNATPHNDRFSFPQNQSSPTAFAGFSPVESSSQGSRTSAPAKPTAGHGSTPVKGTFGTSTAQFTGGSRPLRPAPTSQQHKSPLVSNYNGSSQPGGTSFVTTSFVQQFGETSLQGSTSFQGPQGNTTTLENAQPQMQTPPPTRHTDAKRKPQQPPIELTTPSTIAEKRLSTPNQWQNQNTASFMDASPFPLSPLDFFNTGPLTAPVGSHTHFWDSGNAFDSSPLHPSGMHESAAFWSSPPMYQPILPSNMPVNTNPSPLSQKVTRPSTAAPVSSLNSAPPSLQAPPTFVQSHVNPSLISKTDALSLPPPVSPLGESFLFGNHSPELRPAQLEVPKRDDRARKNTRAVVPSITTSRPVGTLRRSVTDSRSRRNLPASNRLSLTSSTDLQDFSHDTQAGPLLRTGSPLKRQRSDTLSSAGSVSRRRSVVLRVDENGYATTEIQVIDEGPRSNRVVEHTFSEADESDSEGDLPASGAHSRTSSAVGPAPGDPTKPRSSAQDALREMRDHRRKAVQTRSKALDTALMPPPGRTLAPALSMDMSSHDSDSPTTISDPGMLTTDHLFANTRCMCGVATASPQQQSMIQCGSCLNWLHTVCVGLNPLHLPSAYLCNFCTSSNILRSSRR